MISSLTSGSSKLFDLHCVSEDRGLAGSLRERLSAATAHRQLCSCQQSSPWSHHEFGGGDSPSWAETMGSSAKKKKEKKKDFQKTKLKVGKTKAKVDSYTDTSFKAKALVLSQQFSSTADGTLSAASQFARHASLLRHRSDTQRQESLAYLTVAVASRAPGESLPEPVATLLPKLQPLLLDGSPSVRQQLLKLLKCLPQEEIRFHADQLLLYTRAGMTHLSADIRLFSMDALDWLIEVAGNEVVSCAGAWIKTLRCLVSLLSWQGPATPQGGWSAVQKPSSKPGTEARALSRHATTLASYIRAGIHPPAPVVGGAAPPLPLWHVPQHALAERSNAFAHLRLFGSVHDEENAMHEDRDDRQRVFATYFEPCITAGVEDMKREGGELGRAAAAIRRAMEAGMRDYERDD